MAKGDSKKSVVIEIVTTSKQPEPVLIPFEYKGVRILTPSGDALSKDDVARIAGNKLRKFKVDLSDFMKAYLKAIKKK